MKKFFVAAVLSLVALTAQAEPALYGCQSRGNDGLFFVISPDSGEFMVFDSNGGWLNAGQFSKQRATDGTPFYYAEVGTVAMGWSKLDSRNWRLVILSDGGNTKTEYVCR